MVLLADAAAVAASKDAAEATARTIQEYTNVLTTLFTLVTAGLLWWYTSETQKLREESQKQNRNQLLPVLVPVIESLDGPGGPQFVVLRNVGSGPAFNITAPAVSLEGDPFNKVVLTSSLTENVLAPNEHCRLYIRVAYKKENRETEDPKGLAMVLSDISTTFSAPIDFRYYSANGELHVLTYKLGIEQGVSFDFVKRTQGKFTFPEPEKPVEFPIP